MVNASKGVMRRRQGEPAYAGYWLAQTGKVLGLVCHSKPGGTSQGVFDKLKQGHLAEL
jgi:hypothetical protein